MAGTEPQMIKAYKLRSDTVQAWLRTVFPEWNGKVEVSTALPSGPTTLPRLTADGAIG